MPYAYLGVKLLHVFLAIVAIGSNVTYGAWFARANADPEFAPFALRGIKFIDSWIANPAYILLLPYLGYSPTLSRQLAAVERDGIAPESARGLAVRANVIAAIIGIIVLVILVLMIFKPT